MSARGRVKKVSKDKSVNSTDRKTDARDSQYFNISKFGTINEDLNSELQDSGYEYGLMLEENINSHTPSHQSSLNVGPIRHNDGLRGSRTNILGDKSHQYNSNKEIHPKTAKHEYYTAQKKQMYAKFTSKGFPFKRSVAESSTNDKSLQLGVRTAKPNSAISSRIEQKSQQEFFVDRSTCVQKPKPNNQRPQIWVRDDESEIYDGEENSFRDSEFHSEEEQIEMITQSISSSKFNGMGEETKATTEQNNANKSRSKATNYRQYMTSSSPQQSV
jgi:hypothetical protein